MGASESLANEFKVVEDFNNFVILAKISKKTDLLSTLKTHIKKLKEQSEKFFETYESLQNSNKIGGEGIDLNNYFQKIVISIAAFKECVTFVRENAASDGIATVAANFRNDFRKFVKQLTQLASLATQILFEIMTKVSPSLMTDFYLELDIFDFALNVKQIDKPPYYLMSTSPVYELRDQIAGTDKCYVNVISPHGSGKTTLVPLFLASRSLKSNSQTKFVIVVEHETSLIHQIKNTYLQVCYKEEADDFDYDEDNVSLYITSSLGRIVQLIKKPPFFPVVGILSPADALRLTRSVDLQDFVLKSIFVIDDVQMRTVETDVLVQDLQRSISRLKKGKKEPRLVTMSTIRDDRILSFIGHSDDFTPKNVNNIVDKKEIRCKSISEIRNVRLFKEMRNFFNTWMDESIVSVGSVVVFVPSEKVGQRVYREIFKFYSNDNAVNVCPLRTTIRKGETTDDFYNRLMGEMMIAEGERPKDIHTLFLMPVYLSNNITPEELALIRSQLPLPFIDKLARVFITTIKNESFLQIQDLMIIFDTGIEEVEFYDAKQSTYHVREKLLPKPFMEQHHQLLGSCGDGLYFEFCVTGSERPNSLIPSVKRSDLGRQLLLLRSFGVKLEEMRNLPNEPDHDLLDGCFENLKQIGAIDDTRDKNLTEIGKVASKYSSVSPFFAIATAKFNDNNQFAFLCSLVIENSRTLVTDPKSPLLCKNFNRESDVVTLLESILEVTEGGADAFEGSGLSIGSVYAMYSQIENTFEGAEGRTAVINSIKWSKSQPGGILGTVDKFVSLIDQNYFLNKRKCQFVHVLGAGPGSEPTLIYKACDDFKFSKKKKDDGDDKEEDADDEPKIKFARRPGWLGLQSPGNIFALSVVVEEGSRLNRGLIIHRNVGGDDNPGVVSMNIENPSLNSFFFVSLFEAYWSGHSTVNEFIGIYHTPVQKKESAFLIHMTENDGKTFLNYCPRNTAIENSMKAALPLLSSLMPFVPRSIIAKVDTPICAIEVNGYGACNQYTTHIHLIAEPDTDLPFAYPINKATLEYAYQNINQLRKTLPLVRFAITGESFYYKLIHGREVEADLTYPDVTQTLRSVFDPNHSSHLVLIVDKNYPNKPPVGNISWMPVGGAAEADVTDNEDSKMMIDVTSKVMTGLGYAEKGADIFFITLGGGFPTAVVGEVPEFIRNSVGFSAPEGGAIKLGVYPLVRHFVKDFTRKQRLTEEISLKQLGSTNAWRNYPTNEEARNNLLNQISTAIINHFHLKPEDEPVQATFFGQSMLVIHIEGLAENLVTHRVNSNVWDDTYQPCQADNEIINVLRSLGTVDFQITQVIHEPSINVCVNHMRRLGLSEKEFTEKIQKISEMFGFLKMTIPEYTPPAKAEDIEMGVLGFIQSEFIGMASGLAFATLVSREFPLKTKDDIYLTQTMATCLGMTTINPRLKSKAPKIGVMQKAVKVTPAEVEALKELVAMKNAGQKKKKWNLDANFNILILPATEEAAMQEMMKQVRDKEEDTTCQYVCEPPQVFLPQSIYSYQKDGSVKAIAICKQCLVEHFRSMEELQSVMDPITHMINRRNLSKLENNLPGFAFIGDDNEGDEYWPQIPLGQGVWAVMSDQDAFGFFVKAWFTAIIDFIVRMARNYFTFCPNHPDIPHRTPKPGTNIRCPYCNMFYCDTCKRWHRMDEACAPIADGIKRCPNCHTPTFKVSGCNHITCPCGKHWCYKCTPVSPIFNTAGECYTHLTNVHGGYNT